MNRKCKVAFALAIALAGPGWASAQVATTAPQVMPAAADSGARPSFGGPIVQAAPATSQSAIMTVAQPPPGADPAESRAPGELAEVGKPEPDAPLGPTPLLSVGILQKMLFGDDDKTRWKIAGWLDADYTYRSTGPGINNVAPVQNRFGDEATLREMGLFLSRSLDQTTWSWGFNMIFIAGADASFLTPVAGGWNNPNPRFGADFTDLNLTFHAPILTEGGVDVKVGRQTTVLGPEGALSWQRPFNSNGYAWYNEEEGRFTGVTTNWYINKQLSWYNGVEIGGWGVFFDDATRQLDYITQVNYWLDADAKETKVFATLLTGPTGRFDRSGNTTVFEFGVLHNWNKYVYTLIDTQLTYSKAPIFFNPPPGYQERAYDVYMWTGVHLNTTWDVTARLEWYRDEDGGGYPGGFGVPHTSYYSPTLGLNYHPTKWAEFRPEIRYDYATNPNFGANSNLKNQLTISADLLLKF